MQLSIAKAEQWLIYGLSDDVVPPAYSRNYVQQKRQKNENVHLVEVAQAGHYELIDPHSVAWPKVEQTALHLLGM
jgi:hypothetical protein